MNGLKKKIETETQIGTPEQMLLTEKIRNFIAVSKVDPDLIYHKFVSTVDKSDKTFVLVRVD